MFFPVVVLLPSRMLQRVSALHLSKKSWLFSLISPLRAMGLFLIMNSFFFFFVSLRHKFVIVVCQILFAELMIYFEKQLNVTWEESVGRLCNQKEIRHQLLTLAGCRVPSRCCFSLFGVRSISALSAFFFSCFRYHCFC